MSDQFLKLITNTTRNAEASLRDARDWNETHPAPAGYQAGEASMLRIFGAEVRALQANAREMFHRTHPANGSELKQSRVVRGRTDFQRIRNNPHSELTECPTRPRDRASSAFPALGSPTF